MLESTSGDNMRKYRHELKFIISSNMAEILKMKLAPLMDVDANSIYDDKTYLIRSLYFDDMDSSAYYEKMDGVEFRKKYRIRIYNMDDSFIRLECKYKHNNMTSKDQLKISKDVCDKIVNSESLDIDLYDNKFFKQFYVDKTLKGLKPSIIVDYKRLAYTYPISDVRITFDSKIRSGLYNYNLFDENINYYSIIDDDEVVLEVKFNEILPEPIAIILSTVPTARQAFSKFAHCRSIK